jgi:O-acetylhomoserine (thiol)-lyase
MPGFSTKAIHGDRRAQPEGALRVPVYDAVAFEFDSASDMQRAFEGRLGRHAYSRITNPTVQALEQRIGLLSDALGVLAVSSGMAAITNVLMSLAGPGDNIITSRHLFGNTIALFTKTLADWGLETRFGDLTDPEAAIALADNRTRALFFETITNPHLEVADCAALCAAAGARGVPVIADTTLTPPYLFRAGDHGVAVEILSSTKYLSGGATSVGGLIIDTGRFDWANAPRLAAETAARGPYALLARLRSETYRNTGACLSPHAAWLQLLGLETLALRIEKSCDNAMRIATFLDSHPAVRSVAYPGLPHSPFHDIADKQFGGRFGALIACELADRQSCYTLIDRLSIIRRATNFNDNKSLIIHPASTIYAEFSPSHRRDMHIDDAMTRLGVGIEESRDLIDDLSQALEAV